MTDTHVIMIRLRCKGSTCRRVFEIPDTVFADDDFADKVRCPECGGGHVGETEVQPCPRMWWSDTYGLITEVSRHGDRRLMWTEAGIGPRQTKTLPPDAIALRRVPRPDGGMIMSEESDTTERQRAADRVSAFLDEHGKVDDGSNRGEIYRLNDLRLLVADLRLLVAAAPVLPPKWSHLLADPERDEAAARAREVLTVLEAQGPEADVFRDGLVALSVRDLEALCRPGGPR